MVGALLLLYPADHLRCERNKRLLQPLLRQRAAVWPAGGPLRSLPQKGHSKVDEKQRIPIWISGILFCHVLCDALEHLSGVCGSTGLKAGGDAAVDVQAALAVGLSRNIPPSRRGAVRLWILQRDADLHCSWPDHHGAVQTPQLVCVLPYGDHDPAGLQGAEQQSVMSSRNGRYSLGKI